MQSQSSLSSRSSATADTIKVRAVVQGQRMIEGVDFNQTFAPVVRVNTLRVILANNIGAFG